MSEYEQARASAITTIRKFHSFGDVYVSPREAEALLDALIAVILCKIKEDNGDDTRTLR